MKSYRSMWGFALAAVVVAGCNGGEDGDGCLDPLPRDCAIVWADYDAIHGNMLGTTCASGGCHDAASAQGGLTLAGADVAYDALLQSRVIPGDPECSELVKRLYATGAEQMPPGVPLSDAQKCSIVRWIADGAARD